MPVSRTALGLAELMEGAGNALEEILSSYKIDTVVMVSRMPWA